jgi:hypothetical protein
VLRIVTARVLRVKLPPFHASLSRGIYLESTGRALTLLLFVHITIIMG